VYNLKHLPVDPHDAVEDLPRRREKSAFLLLGDNIMMNQEFQKVLDMYRQNLTEYKMTGNSAYKTATDTTKAWLDSYIKSLEKETETQAKSIREFVSKYEQTNPDLVEMQERMKKIREEGPKLQDIYETEMEAQEEEAIDYTRYYVKAGLITGVFAVLVVTSFF
jgi:flagellar biosynthesis chaperone FliJ